MEADLDNLNKITEIREKMIYAILDSKKLSNLHYDKMEQKLIGTSFIELQRKYKQLKGM